VKYLDKQFLFEVEFVTHLYSQSQNSITINNILKRIYIVSKQVLVFCFNIVLYLLSWHTNKNKTVKENDKNIYERYLRIQFTFVII
jgi:hypothetical protein